MTIEELKEQLIDSGAEGSVVFENPDYADACIGISEDNRVIYDYDLMIKSLMDKESMTEDDAAEFISYNTIRSLPYIEIEAGNSPIILYKIL